MHITTPWSTNRKGYAQLRGTVINEKPPASSGDYNAVPATGAARNSLPTHAWVTNATKFQLHQLVAKRALIQWSGDEAHAEHVKAFHKYFAEVGVKDAERAAYEMSHLCLNKLCTNPEHLWPEPSPINKSRDYCPVVVYINDEIHGHCTHEPKCVATTHKKSVAFKYNVPLGPITSTTRGHPSVL